ncbi:uncharacterized protein LOC116189454 [Punica granatum]|uniref:Uncharacterized protein n=2 Tax=Punica granatum TaxID=22663 RepID=A0A218XZX5_PUNGR|nr:uncharacterized protein LOC116189454 [Punica granatum]OWM90149.1 hypothetical protein CDL15_Pgr006470 [Punica granatum]PKI53170.1 hypothetical protein CRG98_026431 [Punica granatum]
MNGQRDDNPSSCYYHPDVAFVGVCPLCLNERLVVLAAKQKQSYSRRSIPGYAHSHKAHYHQPSIVSHKKPPLNIPKIFAIGSLLNRLEFRRRTDSLNHGPDASSSPEDDSFISIKFEDNGIASWEKNTVSKVSLDNCNISWNQRSSAGKALVAPKEAKAAATMTKSVIEHSKPRVASLRWRKRIGHLFHLMRWKRSNKAGSVCHVGSKVEGVKVRNGWIRTLTKRRTKE